MAHRALVARSGDEGRWAVHEASRGACDLALLGVLSPAGEREDRGRSESAAWADAPGPVAPEPVAVADAFDAVVREHVDPIAHEALFRVTHGSVRASLPVHLAVAATGEPGPGLLVGLDPREPRRDWGRVRAAVRGMRAALAAVRDRERLDPAAGARIMAACVRAEAGDRPVRPIPSDDGEVL